MIEVQAFAMILFLFAVRVERVSVRCPDNVM